MPGRLLTALLVVFTLGAAAPPPQDAWLRVETRNFIVFGSHGERRLREVAAEFERFREALSRIIPSAATPAAVPTIVVVFGTGRAFAPYRPRFNGKPISIGGYFFASEDTNLVAFADVERAESLRTIFHEYVHLVLVNNFHAIPAWLSEGLAEYYSTFRVESGGRAVLGAPIAAHMQLLSRTRPMSVDELLAVTRESAVYNEGNRRSVFYAQSWALVHMLMSKGPTGFEDLDRYARLVEQGTASRAAWRTVFGDVEMGEAIRRYVQGDSVGGTMVRFDRELPSVRGDVSAVSEADTQATLADLLRRVAPFEEAAAAFERALTIAPPSARARALYALHLLDRGDTPRLDRGDSARARSLLLEAAAARDDWLVQYHVATGLSLRPDGDDREGLDAARNAVSRTLEARAELPNALAVRARLAATERTQLDAALADIRRARELAPGRDDYSLFEGNILLRRGEFVAARSILDALAKPGSTDAVRDAARAGLVQVDRAERAAADRIAFLEGRRPAARDGGESRTGPAVRYRVTESDEERIEGLLERIACTTDGIQLHVSTAAATERFDANTLDSIAFVSYRSDLDPTIRCGARTPPDRVYVTLKKGPAPRRVVAVEFIR